MNGLKNSHQIQSLAELKQLAHELSRQLAGGQLWCLSGELGTGKTELIRQLVALVNPSESVSSPSYNLENLYNVSVPSVLSEVEQISHWDLFRLRSIANLPDLDEQIGDRSRVVFVEWPERYAGLSERADFYLEFKFLPGEQKRQIDIASKAK